MKMEIASVFDNICSAAKEANTAYPVALVYNNRGKVTRWEDITRRNQYPLEIEFAGLMCMEGDKDIRAKEPRFIAFYLNVPFLAGKLTKKPEIKAVPMLFNYCPVCKKARRTGLRTWGWQYRKYGKVRCPFTPAKGQRCEGWLDNTAVREREGTLTMELEGSLKEMFKTGRGEADTVITLPQIYGVVVNTHIEVEKETVWETEARKSFRAVRSSPGRVLDILPLPLMEKAGCVPMGYVVTTPPVRGWVSREITESWGLLS